MLLLGQWCLLAVSLLVCFVKVYLFFFYLKDEGERKEKHGEVFHPQELLPNVAEPGAGLL